jgi:peptide/nickel transport system permease protein
VTLATETNSSTKAGDGLGKLTPPGGAPAGTVTFVVSAIIVGVAFILAVAGPILAPDARSQDVFLGATPPGTPGHMLGTDTLGRDILQLLIAGSSSALSGPFIIALGSMLLGIFVGTTAGYLKGPVDFVIGRVSDILLALPVIVVAIVVAGVFGSGYWVTVGMLILLFSPSDIRLVRAAVLEQSARPYIESARMLRVPTWRIMFRHVLPNVTPIIVTNALVNVAIAIVSLSSLSFLGVGVAPDAADWGRQLADGRALLLTNPAATIAPAVAIITVACAVNLLGDALTTRWAKGGTR